MLIEPQRMSDDLA